MIHASGITEGSPLTRRAHLTALSGLLLAAIAAGPAAAHPHVFVTAKAEIVFSADGAVQAIRNRWSFDEAYSAYITQGLDKNGDGKLTADERPQHKGMRGHGRHGSPRHGDGFKKLDTDGDGRISKAEAAADPRFAARFDAMDANKDGVIDRADRELRNKQRRDAWFAKADADKDGKLTRAEIDQADVARRAEFQQRMQARMDERFAAMDANKDGRLSRDEVKDKGRFAERFDALDTNKDGFLSKDELAAGRPTRR